jgi:hypothetical protein
VDQPLEKLLPSTLPIRERAERLPAIENGLRKLAAVELDVVLNGLLEVLAGPVAMALQHVLDPAVEAFDHAVGLRSHRVSETMLDTDFGAERVEHVLACGAALAQTDQSVDEGLSVDRQHLGDLYWGRTPKVARDKQR